MQKPTAFFFAWSTIPISRFIMKANTPQVIAALLLLLVAMHNTVCQQNGLHERGITGISHWWPTLKRARGDWKRKMNSDLPWLGYVKYYEVPASQAASRRTDRMRAFGWCEVIIAFAARDAFILHLVDTKESHRQTKHPNPSQQPPSSCWATTMPFEYAPWWSPVGWTNWSEVGLNLWAFCCCKERWFFYIDFAFPV